MFETGLDMLLNIAWWDGFRWGGVTVGLAMMVLFAFAQMIRRK